MTQVTPRPFYAEASIRRHRSLYESWKEAEGIATVRGISANLTEVELTPWENRGGSAVFIDLDGSVGVSDGYVYELAPRESSRPVRHMYDETAYVLRGQGATAVWLDGGKKQTFEWNASSLFAIPPNAWYQHFNLSGDEPARYYGMTSAPAVIDAFRSLDFVFDNPYVFHDRFSGEDGYFKQAERSPDGGYQTNFVADVLGCAIMAETAGYGEGRGPGVRSTSFSLVNNTLHNHTSSWPVGVYKRAHRHGAGVTILLLRGQGYSLMWPKGDPIARIDWGPGTVLSPGDGWFHQHFNVGSEPVLFLAMSSGVGGYGRPRPGGGSWPEDIAFEDEDAAIHREFEAELVKNGVPCRMSDASPFCTAK